jgi:hypothetical protein
MFDESQRSINNHIGAGKMKLRGQGVFAADERTYSMS